MGILIKKSITILLITLIVFSFQSNMSIAKEPEIVIPKAETKFKDLPKEEQERIKNDPVYGPKDTSALKNIDMEKVKKLPKYASIGSDGSIITDLPKPKASEKYGFPGSDNEKTDINELISPYVADNLVQTPHTTYPYNAIAKLKSTKPDGTIAHCTGIYIDRNTIITAAHCVYNTVTNTPVTNIAWERSPGPSGLPIYEHGNTTKFWINSAYVNLEPVGTPTDPSALQYDFAAIQVGQDSANWFGIRATNHEAGEQVLATGYPISSDPNSPYYYGDTQYKSLGNISSIVTFPGLLQTTAYLLGGMSGGPTWNTKVGTTAVIGINVGGPEDHSFSVSVRITGNTYNQIVYWKDLPD
ncbi:V8-like Glu-specific endopeptidase [Seinonella peptonophila]|uniref:Serine protease n=1 Tax=Seinonella peptonophila TaxID=112248 RepID=A0A1M5B3T6_9BACL|nr:trypsin-like peptidase domain-containing protein [Seinonella peptonophila]SHF37129.1 V8-like Glu-specific endopeptidase [Seinonella peptonophila]